MRTFASQSKIKRFAQMAESVDALVSNTSGVTSIPVRPRVWVLKEKLEITSLFLYPKFDDNPSGREFGNQRKNLAQSLITIFNHKKSVNPVATPQDLHFICLES